jgi:hypothetical protein
MTPAELTVIAEQRQDAAVKALLGVVEADSPAAREIWAAAFVTSMFEYTIAQQAADDAWS